MTLASGSRLGPYEVLALIGAGGMGEVYRARDGRLGREVAIKVLPETVAADPERLQRFEQEARSASALNHPNIVTIHDVGQTGGVSWIAMELVEGQSLRQLLAAGALSLPRTMAIGAQVAEGLGRAHAAGIVHRDLKPENVMVTADGLVKILDFGLAKPVPGAADDQSQAPTAAPQTEAGIVVGTIGYMSPEQATGRPVDYRSDQFALGAMLYEMASGRRAFARPTRRRDAVGDPQGRAASPRGRESGRPRAARVDRAALPRQGAGGPVPLDARSRAGPRRAAGPAVRRGGRIAGAAGAQGEDRPLSRGRPRPRGSGGRGRLRRARPLERPGRRAHARRASAPAHFRERRGRGARARHRRHDHPGLQPHPRAHGPAPLRRPEVREVERRRAGGGPGASGRRRARGIPPAVRGEAARERQPPARRRRPIDVDGILRRAGLGSLRGRGRRFGRDRRPPAAAPRPEPARPPEEEVHRERRGLRRVRPRPGRRRPVGARNRGGAQRPGDRGVRARRRARSGLCARARAAGRLLPLARLFLRAGGGLSREGQARDGRGRAAGSAAGGHARGALPAGVEPLPGLRPGDRDARAAYRPAPRSQREPRRRSRSSTRTWGWRMRSGGRSRSTSSRIPRATWPARSTSKASSCSARRKKPWRSRSVTASRTRRLVCP